MKKLVLLLACLLLLLQGVPARAEQLPILPPVFVMSLEIEEKDIDQQRQFVCKEHLITTNASVNAALRAASDVLEAKNAANIRVDESKQARKNSRLDIETTYSKTGHSWVSALITARISYRRTQTHLDFDALVFDLDSGEQITLADLFPQDSEAWDLIARRVENHLKTVFPDEERDQEAIKRLAAREALESAKFTLGGGEMTLHYLAQEIGLSQPGMVHVRFFYPELEGMMTEEAARQTDNRHWKMVALTFDDGPRWFNSVYALNALRQSGARATFFASGNQFADSAQILRRQFDGNHLMATHTFSHKSGYSLSAEAMQRQIAMCDEITLRLYGEASKYMRAPGGLYPPWRDKKVGLPIIQWSVDTYDYSGKDAQGILRSVKEYTQHGDIILLHDTRPNTYKAIPLIAQYLTDNGYLMVSIEELAFMEGVTMEPNMVYARYADGQYDERKDSNLN